MYVVLPTELCTVSGPLLTRCCDSFIRLSTFSLRCYHNKTLTLCAGLEPTSDGFGVRCVTIYTNTAECRLSLHMLEFHYLKHSMKLNTCALYIKTVLPAPWKTTDCDLAEYGNENALPKAKENRWCCVRCLTIIYFPICSFPQ